jgi:hypothetical protein
MGEEMGFIEGTFRVPGAFWQVVIFTGPFEGEDIPRRIHRRTTWESGITGLAFTVPEGTKMNRSYAVSALAEVFGTDAWVEVEGPDSMVLR